MEEFTQNNSASYIYRYLFTQLPMYKKVVEQLITQPLKQEEFSQAFRLAYIIINASNNNLTHIISELMTLLKQIQLGNLSLTSRQWTDFLLKYSKEETAEETVEDSEEVIYF